MSSRDPLQDGFDNQPDSFSTNPYASLPGSSMPTQPPRTSLLIIPAIFLIIFGGLTVLGGVVQLAGVAANGLPVGQDQDPARQMGHQAGFLVSTMAIPAINLLVVAGGIAMIARRFRGLAMAGAIAAVIPICGPCLVLGIPFGIWALILLNRPDVRATFS